MPLVGRIEALERAMRAGHSSATHDTPSVTNFGHGTRSMRNPNPDLSTIGALELLIHQQPDWTSQNWIALFTSILE